MNQRVLNKPSKECKHSSIYYYQHCTSSAEVHELPQSIYRRMRLKWHFRDEPDTLSETPASRPKSTWVPPKGYPCLEVFVESGRGGIV